jgi:hypothetical protein
MRREVCLLVSATLAKSRDPARKYSSQPFHEPHNQGNPPRQAVPVQIEQTEGGQAHPECLAALVCHVVNFQT